ncbi:hypothetical protein [Streptomyces sp. NPDC002520]
MAFPQTPLDVRIELLINGAWSNVTADVYTAEKISISRGRADESARTDPGKCTLTFNNSASRVAPGVVGRYSPRNPRSDLYGLIGRNTLLRVSVPGPTSYLELDGNPANYAGTPDVAALDITGDLDLRWDGETNWNQNNPQVLIGKWEPAGNQKAYMLRLQNGTLTLHHSTDGFTGGIFSQNLPALPERAALRATLDIDNGAGGRTATFYWAPTMAGPWTQFGAPVTLAGTTATFASTAPLRVAPADLTVIPQRYPVAGRVYKAEVRAGINGTVVASPDFTARTPGTTSFTDSAGLTWTLQGSAVISNRRTRFVGEVSSWPPRWDVSGKDVRVSVEAAGVLRRYGQGAKPLDSTLRRRIPSARPLAYWPMEDGSSATRASSAVSGGQPLRVSGIAFGGSDYPAGSNPLPSLGQSASLDGRVPGAQAGGWHVEMVYKLQSLPTVEQTMLTVNLTPGSGGVAQVVCRVSTAGIRVQGLDGDGNVVAFFLFNSADAISAFTGVWNRLQFYSAVSGSNAYLNVAWRDVVANTWYNSRTTYLGTPGTLTGIKGSWGPEFQGMTIGHLAAFDIGGTTAPSAGVTVYESADDGFRGETAGTRMNRLASEESIPVTVYGSVNGQERMGPQRPETLLSLLEEAADVDGGIFYERRETLGLVYRDRASLYNQTPALLLDYTTPGHVAPPLEPVDDDQTVRNDITVTRDSGASARATLDVGAMSTQAPPNGVGVYDESVTLNLYTDDQPAQHAAWRLHLGTVDEARYPVVNLDLAAAPSLVDAVTALDCGDRVQIANPPAWLPPGPIDLIVQGYSEVLGHPNDWDLQLNCTPASPWSVGVTDDPVLGMVDTDGSKLAAAATANDTALIVQVTNGPVWRWETAFAALVGGEAVTVNAIGPAVSDAFTRTVSSGWGTASTGGTWSTSGGTGSDYSVNGSAGLHSQTSINISRYSVLPAPSADVDVVVSASTSVLAAGGPHYVGLVARWLDANNNYYARLAFNTDQTLTLVLQKRVAGAQTDLVSVPIPGTHAASTLFRVRFQVQGSTLQARAWRASDPDPTLWQATATDTALTAAGSVGVRSILSATNTNTLPVTAAYDDFTVLNPQRFTVTRSANGIVKSQSAGTDLWLAHPTQVAL